MKKIKYYLDTSVFNFLFADDNPEKKKITENLFQKIESEQMEICISEIVADEINNAPEPIKERLAKLVAKYSPVLLPVSQEVKDLATRYIAEGIIPEKYRNDALHISATVVNDIPVLISWNFEHIVKLRTRVGVNGLNKFLGYHEIEICSPEEVAEL